MERITVTPQIRIGADELDFAFLRASGPGGQNVNKVESAVQLRFNLRDSPSLDEDVKRRLHKIAGARVTNEGVIVITAQRFRSQERNRQDAVTRLVALIEAAAERPKKRIATRPSLAAKKRRVESKIKRGATKRLRGAPIE